MTNKLKHIFILSFTILLVVNNLQSQDFKNVDKWINKNLNNLGGRAVLMIYKDNKILYQKSYNNIKIKQKIAAKIIERKTGENADLPDFDIQTKQRIASCSKWLTAALIMTFVDANKIQLEDSIGKYLPIMTKHQKGKIKIWHCLAHLTGIEQKGIGEKDEENKSENDIAKSSQWQTMSQAIEEIATAKQEGEPGKTFHYGNAGLQILAAIIEKIESKSFEQIFQEKIAKPLYMKSTDFGNKPVALAAGGAFSTPQDYINFLQMIVNNGVFDGKRILSEKSIIAMQKNYISNDVKVMYSPAEAEKWGYGFGEWIMNEQENCVSSPGLFGTFPWVDNNKKYAAILFTTNLKFKGRHERYLTLKQTIDTEIGN